MPSDYSTNPISIGKVFVHPIWFDSLGAKSSCILIETPDIKLLVDPGVAEMQPSYPLPPAEKYRLYCTALGNIKSAAQTADTIFISHYHYDHHTLPGDVAGLYSQKQLWTKNPNLWINRSQWERARLFFNQLYRSVYKKDLNLCTPEKIKIDDPMNSLPLAQRRDYGDYRKRKKELLKKGKRWFNNLVKLWTTQSWVPEFDTRDYEIKFVDNTSFKIGSTKIKFTHPFFHGLEYDRVGWVIALVVEYKKIKILYSSDLQGPIIEDYAAWIISENPNVLVLDGPTTYLLGYMLNLINLRRTIENVCNIIRNTKAEVIIYDHHLLRDKLYKERMAEVYHVATRNKKKLITCAEWFSEEPLILKQTKKNILPQKT